MVRFTLLVLTGAFLVAACGGGNGDVPRTNAPAPPGSDAATVVETPTVVVDDELQAAEPVDNGSGLVFQERTLQGEIAPGLPDPSIEITVANPVGWEASNPNFPDIFTPPANAGFDPLLTAIAVGGTCGGGCGPQPATEWAQRAEANEFAQFRDASAFQIVRETALNDGRLVLAVNNFGVVAMTVARWKGGAERYFFCRFSADEDDINLVPDFGAACAQATATFLGP